eukprot:6278147-Prymnesium_polylepis.1
MVRAAGGTIVDCKGDDTAAPTADKGPSTSSSGAHVTIRYSHYSETFPISSSGGRPSLDFALVDAAYRLSHVFQGAFNVRLRRGEGEAATEIKPDGGRITVVDAAGKRTAGGTFSGLEAGAE